MQGAVPKQYIYIKQRIEQEVSGTIKYVLLV